MAAGFCDTPFPGDWRDGGESSFSPPGSEIPGPYSAKGQICGVSVNHPERSVSAPGTTPPSGYRHSMPTTAKRPPPAPSRGGGQCLAIAPDSRARGGNRISGIIRCDREVVVSSRGTVSMGESPPWGRGEADTAPPLPCLLCLWLNGIHGTPPPPGRYRGLLPPPPEGAGSKWR